MNQKKLLKRNPKPGGAPTPPRAVREYTAGGVVYRKRDDVMQILMIQDPVGRWTIPKGHVEEGESLEQTAVREVKEETGLAHLKIRDKLDKIYFFYRKEGKLIFMTTHVYLMEARGDSDKIVPQIIEGIQDVKWFPADEAIKLVEYKDTEKLFKLGLEKLAQREAAKAEKVSE